MAPPKAFHGARAQVIVADPNTGESKIIGIFNQFSYGLTYDTADVFLLGRLSADEIVYTAQEVVGVTASGYRVIDAGPHLSAAVPQLDQLFTHEYIQLAVYDRQTNKLVAKISNVRPTGYSVSINARQLSDVSFQFKGLLVGDETFDNNEPVGSTTLP